MATAKQPRAAKQARRVWRGALVALLVAGCGGGGGRTGTAAAPVALSATTAGLSYKLQIAMQGALQCATMTVATVTPDGRPVSQGSQSCGPAAPLRPLLIQARASRQSIVIDAVSGGCGRVRAGAPGAPAVALVSHCSTTNPTYRATILPAVRRLVIVGLPGVPVINFPRHRCAVAICITSLG